MSFPESADVVPRPAVANIQRQLVDYMPEWLSGHLAPDGVTDYGTVTVSISVPNPHPPLFIRLWRAGGRTALPLIYEQIFAPDTATRLSLAALVHQGLLASAAKVPAVLAAIDESFPTEVVDNTNPPVMFGSVSLKLLPY